MIRKQGRKPYEGYKSIQQIINTGPGKTINQERFEYYIKKKNFKKIEVYQIYSIPIGSKLAYVTKDNKWRSGGFLISIKNSNTLYDTKETLDTYKIYIEYKGFNGALYSLQEDDIRELYILPKKQKKNDKVVMPMVGTPTKYPIYVQDEKGNDVVVKYARDVHDRDRFMNTLKYRNILSRGFVFDGEDGNIDPYDSDTYSVLSEIDTEE